MTEGLFKKITEIIFDVKSSDPINYNYEEPEISIVKQLADNYCDESLEKLKNIERHSFCFGQIKLSNEEIIWTNNKDGFEASLKNQVDGCDEFNRVYTCALVTLIETHREYDSYEHIIILMILNKTYIVNFDKVGYSKFNPQSIKFIEKNNIKELILEGIETTDWNYSFNLDDMYFRARSVIVQFFPINI
jgi:hypothetical protein